MVFVQRGLFIAAHCRLYPITATATDYYYRIIHIHMLLLLVNLCSCQLRGVWKCYKRTRKHSY